MSIVLHSLALCQRYFLSAHTLVCPITAVEQIILHISITPLLLLPFHSAVISMDPFSVLSNVYDVVSNVHAKAAQVQGNREQCQRMSQRIDAMMTPVRALNKAQLTGPNILKGLQLLLECACECERFIDKFAVSGWMQRAWNYSADQKHFVRLNENLSIAAQTLNLGLQIQHTFDRTQDVEDAANDRVTPTSVAATSASGTRTHCCCVGNERQRCRLLFLAAVTRCCRSNERQCRPLLLLLLLLFLLYCRSNGTCTVY